MRLKKSFLFLVISVLLLSCWKIHDGNSDGSYQPPKVWGYKPVYGTEISAKNILYTPIPQPVVTGGNIYAYRNYIFQMEPGMGIHVIDNSVPSAANRIGFITVNGCSQISIKDSKIYTNSYDDLVVLDFSNLNNIREYSRLKGVFFEYRYGSPISQPPTRGYYECPSQDGFVIGWVRDSVFQRCFKN